LVEYNISRNNHVLRDGHVDVSWLSVTVLQTSLTSADNVAAI